MTHRDATHDLTRTPPQLLRRARVAFFLVAVIVPTVITAVAVVILLTWLPTLPTQVVTHWGPSGADGFGAPSTYLWLLIALGLGLPVLMAVATLASAGAHWGGTARLMGALAAGMAALAAILSLVIPRDPARPHRCLRRAGRRRDLRTGLRRTRGCRPASPGPCSPASAPNGGARWSHGMPCNVAEGERVVWVATTTMPRGALAFLFFVLLGLVALGAFMLGTGVEGGWIVAVVVLFVGLALAATASFRVKVTPQGFSARGTAEVAAYPHPARRDRVCARRRDLAVAEFGGWGWRISVDGRSGIVHAARFGDRGLTAVTDGRSS